MPSQAGDEPDTGTVAPRQYAEAVMLDFMQPAGTGRRCFGGRRQTRLDNAQPGAGTLTQRHAGLIETRAQRVESKNPGRRFETSTGAREPSERC